MPTAVAAFKFNGSRGITPQRLPSRRVESSKAKSAFIGDSARSPRSEEFPPRRTASAAFAKLPARGKLACRSRSSKSLSHPTVGNQRSV